MKTTRAWLAVTAITLVLSCGKDSTGAGPVFSTLQNDDFISGGSPAFQGGFAIDEEAAVRLGPKTAGYTIRNVHFLFGGDTATQTITLTIYADTGGANPGLVQYSADYAVKGSDNAMHVIDLIGQNIQIAANQTIRVSIGFPHAGVPSVATDAAIMAGRNWINVSGGGWTAAATVGMPGDFIIRADISTP